MDSLDYFFTQAHFLDPSYLSLLAFLIPNRSLSRLVHVTERTLLVPLMSKTILMQCSRLFHGTEMGGSGSSAPSSSRDKARERERGGEREGNQGTHRSIIADKDGAVLAPVLLFGYPVAEEIG